MSTRSRPLYYLVGPTGAPNFGDELIAATWLRYLAEVDPDAEVVLDCLNPIGIADVLRRINPRLHATTVLWPLCFRNWEDGLHTATSVSSIVTAPRSSPVPIDDLAEDLELLRRADVVHLIGGGFLNNIWPGFHGLLGGIAAAVRWSGGVAAATGQGMWPPAEGSAELLAELLGQFTVVDVRDTPSVAMAGPNASCSGDDAFLGLAQPPRPPADLPEMMISIQSQLAAVGTAELVELVAKTVVEWGVRDVGLLECAPGEDQEVLAMVERAIPSVRRFGLDQVLADGLPAAPGQCWLSTRFHPHLFAAAAGASGVAINVNGDYYGTKHRSLTERGSRWQILDKPGVAPRPTAGGFSAVELAGLQAGKRVVADRIYRPGQGG